MSTTAPTFNALSVACPNDTCKAEVDQLCRSKSGKTTKTPHRARVLAAGGTVPRIGRASKKTRTRRVSATPKATVKQGINSATIGEFMDDLEKLREKWTLDEATMIGVRDMETDRVLAAAFDNGAWLVTMGN